MPLQELVEDYIAHCWARGLSPKTIEDNYGYALRRVWLPWCEAHGVDDVKTVDRRMLDRFSRDLQTGNGHKGKPRRPETVRTYVESVNWWLRWCHQEGETIQALRASAPRSKRPLLDVLSREEIDAMEMAVTQERNRVIIRLLADTGIRLNELLQLTRDDLIRRGAGREHYIRVHGKGALDRLVAIDVALFRRLERLGGDNHRIFVALRRDARGRYRPLTKSGVEQLVRDAAKRAHIDKRVYPHLLRHSFATWALNQGMNPITLARHLGHESLAMIQRVYAHQTATDVHDAVLRLLRQE